MSGRFVRASKFRHVYGRSTKKEQCYDNLRISKNAWDTNLVKANPSYLSVNWEASGGGAFAVIPLQEKGRLPEHIPLFRGHTAAVLDTDWSPFDDSFVASGSDDGKVFLWRVPEGFTLRQDSEDIQDVKPASKLTGHSRKVGHVLFNPAAQDVLASSSGDYTVKLWDVTEGSAKLTLKHNDIVQSLSWSANGSLLATTSRDKKLRIWDTRQQKPAMEAPGHSGAKNSRVVWLGDKDRVATTGFSKMSDRQLGLWDVRAGQQPIDGFQILDQISGVCMPFWDDGTQCLYLAGKGDGNIRYYEYENDKFESLSQHSSSEPQRGVAFLPKRGINTHENEVARAYRTVNDSLIEPVPFIVPRRAEVFQDDIYPPTVGTKPAMTSSDWFAGKEGLPPKISLESIYEGQPPEEVPGDYKPAQAPKAAEAATPPKKASQQEPTPEPEADVNPPAATRGPPPSMKDNQKSIASMASKFADEQRSESSDDETSSFEEVTKPVGRGTASSAAATLNAKTSSESVKTSDSKGLERRNASSAAASLNAEATSNSTRDVNIATTKRDEPTSIDRPTTPPSIEPQPSVNGPSREGHRSTSSASSMPGTAAGNLKGHLQDIKDMLAQQHQMLLAHNEKIEVLMREVEALKSPGGSSSSSKDERIRMLELELEQARS